MIITINPETLDQIFEGRWSYRDRIKQVFDINKPITVLGTLKGIGDNGDYYYTITHDGTNPANIDWAQREIAEGKRQWHPLSPQDNLEDMEKERRCKAYWLPTIYAHPPSNKYSKNVLSRYDN